jgi:protein-disulfide isomerase
MKISVPTIKDWAKRNGPLVIVIVFAILALLYLGDHVVKQRQSRVSIYPVAPKALSDDPKQGSENPQVTVIVFEDFSCLACKEEVSALKDLVNNFGSVLQVVWKDAPLDPLRPQGKTASIAAHCAGKQEKFWEMYELLFKNQESFGRETYIGLAKELQLNESQFTTCIDKQQTLAKVEENIKAAEDAKLTAVPTFYINGEKFEGYMEYDEFVDALPR